MSGDGDEAAFERFRARTAELGLSLDEDDLRALFAGWTGLQGQLERVRRDLHGDLKPPRPAVHGSQEWTPLN